MDPEQMERLFRTHRDAEKRRDFDGIMQTFTEQCYLETIALGSRSEGQAAARAAYVAYFTAFPDLTPDDRGVAFGDNVMVAWGFLNGTSGGEWIGVPPSGGAFSVAFTNIATFAVPADVPPAGTPRLNGEVERSHRIDPEEFSAPSKDDSLMSRQSPSLMAGYT